MIMRVFFFAFSEDHLFLFQNFLYLGPTDAKFGVIILKSLKNLDSFFLLFP